MPVSVQADQEPTCWTAHHWNVSTPEKPIGPHWKCGAQSQYITKNIRHWEMLVWASFAFPVSANRTLTGQRQLRAETNRNESMVASLLQGDFTYLPVVPWRKASS